MSHGVNKMGASCSSNAISHMDVIACITEMVLGVTLLLCNCDRLVSGFIVVVLIMFYGPALLCFCLRVYIYSVSR